MTLNHGSEFTAHRRIPAALKLSHNAPHPPRAAHVCKLLDTQVAGVRYSHSYQRESRHGIRRPVALDEVWIVGLENSVIERHSAPSGGEFTEVSISSTSDRLGLSMLGGVGVDFSIK
jgi:hypothetical protein